MTTYFPLFATTIADPWLELVFAEGTSPADLKKIRPVQQIVTGDPGTPGIPVSPLNPFPVKSYAGSTGVVWSANQPAIPDIGQPFGGTGPYADYVLIATVPANPARAGLQIENNSVSILAIVTDDGSSATGVAPVNGGVFALQGAYQAGQQGGSLYSEFSKFQGRVQVYAPPTPAPDADVYIRED